MQVPDLRFGPIPKRIDLDDSKLFVPLDNMNALACQRLIPPKTTNPGVDSTQCPHQGVDFAYRATELAILHALVEQVNTMFAHHRLHFVGLRRKHFNSAHVSASVLSISSYDSGNNLPVSRVNTRMSGATSAMKCVITWSSAPSEVAKQSRFPKTLEAQRITSGTPMVAASSCQATTDSLWLCVLLEASDGFIGVRNRFQI